MTFWSFGSLAGSLARAAAAAALLTGPALAQPAAPPCGETADVRRGDTVSRIAERCDVSERRILRLNPRIDGSRDLRVGMTVRVRGGAAEGGGGEGGGPLDRLGSVADNAADALAGLARDVESSAQDLLDKNPDLRRRLEGFGQRLGGTPDAQRPVQGTVSVSPAEASAGAAVTVTAEGLPPEVPVIVGAGAPQAAYETVGRARTGPDGRLRAEVRVPDWASDLSRIVFVVAAEDAAWSLRAAPVRVAGGRP